MAEIGKISGSQLALVLCVFRLSTLLVIKSISLEQLVLELVISVLLCAFVYAISSRVKVNKTLAYLVALFVLVIALSDAAEYFVFLSQTGRNEIPLWAIILFLTAFSIYSAAMKIEAVSRFCAPAVIFCLVCFFAISLANIRNIELQNLTVLQSREIKPLYLLKCVDMPLVFLLLKDEKKKENRKCLSVSLLISYSACFLLNLMCRVTMGESIKFYKHPVLVLFQLGEAGSFTKLDLMFPSVILILLLCELALALSLFYKVRKEW
ncbi:MAG: GerAB/ArcD/ProY family transporter [Eubacterium sp.]|nr:GerAB/ArcD/ProY family transporter [Eubacterium sp.]